MIIGISGTLPHALLVGLSAQGVSPAVAHHVATLPPVTTLFASFLGYNPMVHLLGAHVISTLSPSARATVVGREFFPRIIQKAFAAGLHPALDFAAIVCALAAVTSWMRGARTTQPRASMSSDSVEPPTNTD
jgi:hypothetical protein